MSINGTPTPGCGGWCCKVTALAEVPPKPAGIAWVEYAPCLTGAQLTQLARRWERRRVEAGQAPRRVLTGWAPATSGR